MKVKRFRRKIVIQPKKKALKEAKSYQTGLVMWTDGSELDHSTVWVVAAIGWREKAFSSWKEKNVFLGKNKETFDAKL